MFNMSLLKCLIFTTFTIAVQGCLYLKPCKDTSSDGCANDCNPCDDSTQKQNIYYVINNSPKISSGTCCPPRFIPVNGASQNDCKYGLYHCQTCQNNNKPGLCCDITELKQNTYPGFQTKLNLCGVVKPCCTTDYGAQNSCLNYGQNSCPDCGQNSCPDYGTTPNCCSGYSRVQSSSPVYGGSQGSCPRICSENGESPVFVTIRDGEIAIGCK